MNKLEKILVVICLSTAIMGCGQKENDYKAKLKSQAVAVPELSYSRYEDALFNLDTADFQQQLKSIQKDFMPFLEGDLDNAGAVTYIKNFATDTFAIEMYHKVQEAYPDMSYVKDIVETIYSHFNYYYPDVKLPEKVYTCVSGIDPQTPSVQIIKDQLVISLDWYLSQDAIYDEIGMPNYRKARTEKLSMAKDVAQTLYFYYLYKPRKQSDMLNEMVNTGRVDYFVEAMYPDITDEALLGYSADQMKWAESNEGQVWADVVGNQRLYATGLDMYIMFFGDGPFTQEYSNDAPARLGEFLGLHVIRSYMSNNNNVTLQELMDETDMQSIFQKSDYKPKK